MYTTDYLHCNQHGEPGLYSSRPMTSSWSGASIEKVYLVEWRLITLFSLRSLGEEYMS